MRLGPLSEGKQSAVAVVNDSPVDCQSCDRAARRRLSAKLTGGVSHRQKNTPSTTSWSPSLKEGGKAVRHPLFLSFLADVYKFDPDVNFAGFAFFIDAETPDRQDAFFVCDDGNGIPVPLGELLVDEPLF